MKRKLKLEIYHGELIVFSQWTGEVCYPWELRKILGMIRDLRMHDFMSPIYEDEDYLPF